MRFQSSKFRIQQTLAILGMATALTGCMSDRLVSNSTTFPIDYRERHPMRIVEGDQRMEIFVGTGRGRLTDTQHNEIVQFAREWRREATSTVTLEMPKGSPNDVAAKDVAREVRSLLAHGGAPSAAVKMTNYAPAEPGEFAPIRISYRRIEAKAGPCGLWPHDMGTAGDYQTYIQNAGYYNYACAYQNNLAAMVANPHDLVQPRGETPVYMARRTVMMDKYRQGAHTASEAPQTTATSSDVGN